jgi:hypothetical protein
MVAAAFGMVFGRVFSVNGNTDGPVKCINVGTGEQDSKNVSDNKGHDDTCLIGQQKDKNSYEIWHIYMQWPGTYKIKQILEAMGTRQKFVVRD